ncbi:TatD family hydrolase [Marinobacterium sp. AK62]|uniref:TatD family hydrolase n=1 Tax=Marinobacterium alkalitolerans TaxID=1542925 RepID=A0ABS3Z8V1_9GAMM|nr:TatD family hydrolase [Marinobacterium alkalitolerans]MBP0048141.1 TatD family hydrolase [Marinobacterium alkalitolerans]
MLIDTHCHLDFPDFDTDRDAVIERALEAGVGAIIVPSVTVDNVQRVLDLCAASSRFYPALGLHPCFSHDPESALTALEQALQAHRQEVVAVGEIGLDFRSGQPDVRQQESLLVAQLQLAKAHDLPVLLHAVRSHDAVLKQLRRAELPRAGIVHAFSGSEQQAREYARLGFKLGFGGACTHDRARKLQRLATELPLEWLVLETDAPDMPLQGHQGERNEPGQVAVVAAHLAALRGISLEELLTRTCANAAQVLGLDPGQS